MDFRTLNKRSYVKGIKPFISGLTIARGSNQPFRSNAIDFQEMIFRLLNFENTFTDTNIITWITYGYLPVENLVFFELIMLKP